MSESLLGPSKAALCEAAEGLERERSRTRTEPGRSLRILGPDSDGKCGHLRSPQNSSSVNQELICSTGVKGLQGFF